MLNSIEHLHTVLSRSVHPPSLIFFFFSGLRALSLCCPLDYLAFALVLPLLLRSPLIIASSCTKHRCEISVSARGFSLTHCLGQFLEQSPSLGDFTDRRQLRRLPSTQARRENGQSALSIRHLVAATPEDCAYLLQRVASEPLQAGTGQGAGLQEAERMPRPPSSYTGCPTCLALRRPRSSTPPNTPI